jgi:DNA-directed RNA polymerase specialized sigma24 family protein
VHWPPFDAEYIRRLTDDDPVVKRHFVAHFNDLLFVYLRRRLRSKQLIEEIRQETILRVFQFLRQDGKLEHPERFGGFVLGIGKNVMKEGCRAIAREDQLTGPCPLGARQK